MRRSRVEEVREPEGGRPGRRREWVVKQAADHSDHLVATDPLLSFGVAWPKGSYAASSQLMAAELTVSAPFRSFGHRGLRHQRPVSNYC